MIQVETEASFPLTRPLPKLKVRGGTSPLLGPMIGLVTVFLLFTLLIGARGELGQFLSFDNLQVLVQEGTIPGIVALGALLTILTGGIDLSVGSVAALVTVVAMRTYRGFYQGPETVWWSSIFAVAAGLGTGALCGLVNGWVITRLKVPPFITTLGMLGIARGVAVWAAERSVLPFPGERPEWVRMLGRVHDWGFGFNPGFWGFLGLALILGIILHATVFGRHCYAIGSNESTARLCGVPIDRTKVWVYTLAGLITGIGGILLFAHGGSGDPSGADGLELRVIAAVVIGGASLNGGQGSVLGTLIGVLMLEILGNGVSIFNVPIEIRHILIGLIIVGNTALAQWQARGGSLIPRRFQND